MLAHIIRNHKYDWFWSGIVSVSCVALVTNHTNSEITDVYLRLVPFEKPNDTKALTVSCLLRIAQLNLNCVAFSHNNHIYNYQKSCIFCPAGPYSLFLFSGTRTWWFFSDVNHHHKAKLVSPSDLFLCCYISDLLFSRTPMKRVI